MTTDSEIIRRSLEQGSAFAELFDRHAPTVNAFASYRLGRHAAEDVLSETFLVAFRRRADYDLQVESALPWLLGIAIRLTRRHRAEEVKHWRSFAASAGADELSSEGGPDAASGRIDAQHDVTSLRASIARLAPRDRETLLLYVWQEMTYEQIGEALGVPVGTVRSRLHRVRRRLAAARTPQDATAMVSDAQGEADGRV